MSRFKNAEELYTRLSSQLNEIKQNNTCSSDKRQEFELQLQCLLEESDYFEKRKNTTDLLADNVTTKPRYNEKMIEKITNLYQNTQQLKVSSIELFSSSLLQTKDIIKQETIEPLIINKSNIRIVQENFEVQKEKQKLAEKASIITAIEAGKRLGISSDPLQQEKELFKTYTITQNLGETLNIIPPSSLKQLSSIIQTIVKNPEKQEYRMLFTTNPFVNNLIQINGIKQALACLGFIPNYMNKKDDDNQDILTYYLEEPSIEHDFDGWSVWFDKLKSSNDLILNRLKT